MSSSLQVIDEAPCSYLCTYCQHCTCLKNHDGFEIPGSLTSFEAVCRPDVCCSCFAACNGYLVGSHFSGVDISSVTHGYVQEKPWDDKNTSESDNANMQTYNGGNGESGHGRYKGEGNEDTSKIILNSTQAGQYGWHAEPVSVPSGGRNAGASKFVKAARKAAMIHLDLGLLLPEVSLDQLNGHQQLPATIPAACMWLQAMQASKPFPASPLDVRCVANST